MLKNNIYINGLSVVAPGMEDTIGSLAVLSGERDWQIEALSKMFPSALPANEARRTTVLIRLALKTVQSLEYSRNTATVFASSEGDLDIADKICEALATDAKMVSPTLFHNSVHNAPAGYFSIAESIHASSTSLSAGDFSFSAGLLEASTQVSVEKNDVLLVSYDNIVPRHLDTFRHFDYPLGIGLLLSPNKNANTLGSINIKLGNDQNKVTNCFNHSLEKLRIGNPSGLGLPLVEALVKALNVGIALPYLHGNQLLIKVNYDQ